MALRQRSTSKQVVAKRAPETLKVRDLDAEFESLLRNACLKAAGIGASSALAGTLPGAGILLRFVLGELADIAAIKALQENLIESTLELYGIDLPTSVRKPLLAQISALGAGASIGVDALGRTLLARVGGAVGGAVISRVVPLTAVFTSALGNAATTYAIGKRAQAFARLRQAPLDNVADAIRAFTGVDERRLWDWTLAATKETVGKFGSVLRRAANSAVDTAKHAADVAVDTARSAAGAAVRKARDTVRPKAKAEAAKPEAKAKPARKSAAKTARKSVAKKKPSRRAKPESTES